jgi:hypothetical protein
MRPPHPLHARTPRHRGGTPPIPDLAATAQPAAAERLADGFEAGNRQPPRTPPPPASPVLMAHRPRQALRTITRCQWQRPCTAAATARQNHSARTPQTSQLTTRAGHGPARSNPQPSAASGSAKAASPHLPHPGPADPRPPLPVAAPTPQLALGRRTAHRNPDHPPPAHAGHLKPPPPTRRPGEPRTPRPRTRWSATHHARPPDAPSAADTCDPAANRDQTREESGSAWPLKSASGGPPPLLHIASDSV